MQRVGFTLKTAVDRLVSICRSYGGNQPAQSTQAFNPRHSERMLLYRTVADQVEILLDLVGAGQLNDGSITLLRHPACNTRRMAEAVAHWCDHVFPGLPARVIRRAVELDMLCAPGLATPTEAFAALQAGAHALKLFPAEMVGHGGLKALKSVLPEGVELWPVGGVVPETMSAWVAAHPVFALAVPSMRRATSLRTSWSEPALTCKPGK